MLPPNLHSIGRSAFYNCAALARLKFPATLARIGSHALSYTGLTEVDFRECRELAEVGAYAFHSCRALRKVHFGAGLKSCGKRAVRPCPGPTALSSRPSSGAGQFGEPPSDRCSAVKNLQFESTELLMATTFTNCTALEVVSVPKGAPTPIGLPTKVRVELGKALTTAEVPRPEDQQPEQRGARGEVEELRLQLQLARRELAAEKRRCEVLLREQRRLAEAKLAGKRLSDDTPCARSARYHS
jgi:hypothetical protein